MHLKIATSIFALSLGIFASQAQAADMYGQGSSKDNPGAFDEPALRGYAFVGLGIGVHGGGQFTNIDVYDQFDGIGADGLVGGLHGEYLFAMGRFRVGPYAEGGISNVNTEIGGVDALSQDYYLGGGIKAGIVAGSSSLIYARAGYEWASWSTDFNTNIEIDVGSLVLGGGVETMIAQNVSIGLSADYLVPLSVEVDGTDITDYVEESESIRVLARITYRQ